MLGMKLWVLWILLLYHAENKKSKYPLFAALDGVGVQVVVLFVAWIEKDDVLKSLQTSAPILTGLFVI